MNVNDILEFIGEDHYKMTGYLDRKISGIAPIHMAGKGDLVFCRNKGDVIPFLRSTKANVVICDSRIDITGIKDKTLILVDNPALWFIRVAKRFFPLQSQIAIHSTATINDCVKIGENVKIGPGCRIGFDGHGYEKNEMGCWEKFPHYGNVIIEDSVEIGPNTCIARGTLSDTIIGNGTKIDALVHIGHNARIGKNCNITAKCMIGRSIIGDGVWIGPCSSILPGVNVGKGAFIGMGSVVVKDVEEYTLVYGVPAEFIRRLKE